jgi:hypothetical protein
MNIPDPIFIGYFPKKTMGKDSWFDKTAIVEVCSVSNCMSKGPENWSASWKHNDWGLYDTEDLAREIIRENPELFDMYAYKLFPMVFDGENSDPMTIKRTASEDIVNFDFMGYDPVSREPGYIEFGHSPLSCNRGFEKYPVNRFCLLDHLEEAWRITAEIAKDAKDERSWEPGPYYLCDVYRKKSASQPSPRGIE